jgi:hypothetical protein
MWVSGSSVSLARAGAKQFARLWRQRLQRACCNVSTTTKNDDFRMGRGLFFTGANMASAASSSRYRDLGGLADPNQVITRLMDYCTRNPTDPIFCAVEQIYGSAPPLHSSK